MTPQTTPDLLDLAEAVAAGDRTLVDAQRELRRPGDSAAELELASLVDAVSAVRAHARATRSAAGAAVSADPSSGVATASAGTVAVAGQRVGGGPVRLGGGSRRRDRHDPSRWLLVAATIAVGGALVAVASSGTRIPSPSPSDQALVPTASSTATTPSQSTAPTAHVAGVDPSELTDLSTVQMMSASVGWGRTDKAILRTEDGGRTWTSVHDAPSGFTRFVDENTAAFIDGASFDAITTTHDGGRTWHSVTIAPPAGGGPLKLTFASADVGFASWWTGIDHPGALAVFATADGGATWTGPVAGDESRLPSYEGKVELQGGEAGIVWESPGKADNLPFDNRFDFSADGGATWDTRPFPADPLAPPDDLKAPESIRSDGAGHLLLVVREIPAIFDSRDDGRTWTRVRAWTSTVAIEIRSMTAWTAVAWDGSTVDSTTDAGATWRRTDAASPITLGTVSFGSPDVGVALDTSMVWHCHIIVMMQSPDPNSSCAPGQPHEFLRATSDGGRTWTLIAP